MESADSQDQVCRDEKRQQAHDRHTTHRLTDEAEACHRPCPLVGNDKLAVETNSGDAPRPVGQAPQKRKEKLAKSNVGGVVEPQVEPQVEVVKRDVIKREVAVPAAASAVITKSGPGSQADVPTTTTTNTKGKAKVDMSKPPKILPEESNKSKAQDVSKPKILPDDVSHNKSKVAPNKSKPQSSKAKNKADAKLLGLSGRDRCQELYSFFSAVLPWVVLVCAAVAVTLLLLRYRSPEEVGFLLVLASPLVYFGLQPGQRKGAKRR
jgi:hypothetical protein